MVAACGGDRKALARLVSVVEAGGEDARVVAAAVFPRTGRGYTVGITGAPGAGKSTLTGRLVAVRRAAGDEIAVLAVDPSSPFSGGAILGDRIRMQDHATDPGVFIRSLATRGHLGGLTLAVPEVIRVLDATGVPWIVVETVGVGQVEVGIAGAADTTVVVVNPGWGDAVQAGKAGLMEIADVFVLNKADRPGADETEHDLLAVLAAVRRDWVPPVVRTVASEGRGAEAVWEAVGAHRAHLEATGALGERRRARLRDEVRDIARARAVAAVDDRCAGPEFDALVARVAAHEIDPDTAATHLAR